MEEAACDGPCELTVEPVPPERLPRELLAQKKTLDPDAYYDAVLRLGFRPLAFVIRERCRPEPIGCWFMAGSVLYSGLHLDTFIVDRAVRTEARVRACMRIARSVVEAVCRELGMTTCTFSTDRPERMLRLIGDPRLRPAGTMLVFHVESGPAHEREEE